MTLSNDPTAPDFDLAASMAEADRLLREAGWRALPQWKTNEYARANLVAGITPDGLSCHVKDWTKIPPGHPQYSDDTPDTPHEAAAWLVRKFTNAPVFAVAEAPEAAENVGDETTAENSKKELGPSNSTDGQNSDQNGTAASTLLESESGESVLADETPELPESQAADQGDAPASGAVDSGDEGVGEGAPGSVADAASGTAIQRGQVHDEPGLEGADSSNGNYAIDADFEETGGEPEIIEDDSLDLGALEDYAPKLDPDLPDPSTPPSGGVVYFGDDIHVARLAKIGALAEIARARKAVLQEGWTVSEFASLQNLLVRIERKESPDDANARARFSFIEGRSRAMSAIDAYQNAREDELEAHGALLKSEDPYDREMARLAIAAFDPEAGWPE